MKAYLLDTNLLIALFWPSHSQHSVATKWFATHRRKGWATCPLTQMGFIRIVSNPAFSRDAARPSDAIQVLSANIAAKDHQFWPDELPAATAIAFAGARLIGHQQITDAYLLGLALTRGGILVTLDHQISALCDPASAKRTALEIVV